MDKHFLTSLFSPNSIAVFAGKPDEPESQTPQARALHQSITEQRFSGKLVFLDIHASGTLADLATTHADPVSYTHLDVYKRQVQVRL